MYDDSTFGTIIQSRKDREKDDEGPISKKKQKQKQKNQNRTLVAEKLLNEFDAKQSSLKKPITEKQPPKISEDHCKKIKHLKAISPNHKQSTIYAQLEKNNFDLNDALDALMSIPEDDDDDDNDKQCLAKAESEQFNVKIQEQKKSKSDCIALKSEQIANKLLNQFCDQMGAESFDINPKEFDQLFEEITYIIKEDQKEKGVGIYEINDFVDNCFSIKDTLLQGLEEINIDEDDPLVKQTQQFLQDIIKKNVVNQQKRQSQFPTLRAIQPKQANKNNSKNYIQKINDGYKEQKNKQGYFVPRKVSPNVTYYQNMPQNSIYSIGHDPNAYSDIQQLSKQYNGMSIDSLKFIHHHLHDINLCKTFLQKYYPNKKYLIKIEEKKKKQFTNIESKPSNRVLESINLRKKSEEQNYKYMSLGQIREQLDHLFKIKNLFKLTKNKTTNIAYRKQLQRLACKDDTRIQKLCQVSRQKLMQQMADSHPQYVDLHGYRQQQIDKTFDSIQSMIISEFRRGNSKIRTEKYGPNIYVVVKGMTGKGLHSRYGKSILKPALKEWADYYDYKAVENQDSIDVYIKV